MCFCVGQSKKTMTAKKGKKQIKTYRNKAPVTLWTARTVQHICTTVVCRFWQQQSHRQANTKVKNVDNTHKDKHEENAVTLSQMDSYIWHSWGNTVIHTKEGRDESQVVTLTSAGHIPGCGEGGKCTTKTRQNTATTHGRSLLLMALQQDLIWF